MKHRRIELYVGMIIFNAIVIFLIWSSFESPIWLVTNMAGDAFTKIFSVLGMFTSVIGGNYLIEVGTRIKDINN